MLKKYLFKIFMFLTFMSISSQSVWAQSTQVKGTVSSEGLPLVGVSVSVKGTTIGTITDLDGKYTLDVPNKQSIIRYSLDMKQWSVLPMQELLT